MLDEGAPLPFTLRQLQYLLAVYERGGFSRAAMQCHVSQPSLSAQVAQLEEALGIQVFERTGRGIVVTPAGEAVLEQAREVLRSSQDLQRVAETARCPWAATWRFGIIPTLAAYLVPSLAPSLARAHPELKVVWREATTEALVEELAAGRLEAAVVALESELKSLATTALARDPFLLAVAAEHRLAEATPPVSIDDLNDEDVLLLEDGHCLRQQALDACRLRDRDGFGSTSLATLIELVAVGQGVTLLPQVATASLARDPRLVLLEFDAPAPFRTIGLAWRPSSAIASQLEEVATLFRQELRRKRVDCVPRRLDEERPTGPSPQNY